MQILGLKIVSKDDKLGKSVLNFIKMCTNDYVSEMERSWVEIIKERLRRSCDSPLTKYLQIVVNKSEIFNPYKARTVPTAFHCKLRNIKQDNKRLCNIFLAPSSRILFDKQNSLFNYSFNTINDTWQGFGQFVKSYKQFSKGKNNIFHVQRISLKPK